MVEAKDSLLSDEVRRRLQYKKYFKRVSLLVGVILSLSIAAFSVLYIMMLPDSWHMYYLSRNFQCEKYSEERAREICLTLGKYAEFQTHGHVVSFPAFLVSERTILNTWCALKIDSSDRQYLEAINERSFKDEAVMLKSKIDYRASRGAGTLLVLLDKSEGRTEPGLYPSDFFSNELEPLLSQKCP
jgi:hypothetical protein